MVGKFSIRIVPNQTPELVEKVVVDYCNKVWATRKSPNKMTASLFHGGRCWLSDPDHPNYVAGSRYDSSLSNSGVIGGLLSLFVIPHLYSFKGFKTFRLYMLSLHIWGLQSDSILGNWEVLYPYSAQPRTRGSAKVDHRILDQEVVPEKNTKQS